MLQNNLLKKAREGQVCAAVGAKILASSELVSLASSAGYDAVFVDLEHSTFTLQDAKTLCAACIHNDITPFVRVPYQCGFGFVQRVLDAGAMGVVFPHINTAEEARQAVVATKFPPKGKRSVTAALPHFHYQRISVKEVVSQLDSQGSMVLAMIETKEALANVDDIASVDGVDVLLLGANDLSLELGILNDWENTIFQSALENIAAACQRRGKIFGIAGLYSRPDISKRAVQQLGARFVLGHVDLGLLFIAMNSNIKQVRDMEKPEY